MDFVACGWLRQDFLFGNGMQVIHRYCCKNVSRVDGVGHFGYVRHRQSLGGLWLDEVIRERTMSVLKCWTGSAVLLLALAGGVHAEMTVSQSNDPTAALGMNLTALLGQEKAALGAVSAARLTKIVTPPVAKPSKSKSDGNIAYDADWLAEQPAAKGGPEFECLATALYFEARGEGIKGQAAVAEVILNRVESPTFPQTICGVVNQGNSRGCQFSFTCDGRPENIRDRGAWTVAGKIARAMIDGAPRQLTDGATYFHTPAVRPSWAKRFEKTTKIGRHIFYRAPLKTAMN